MAKLRLFYDEFAALGTWSAADAVASFPASLLGHPHLARVAKTGGTTTAQWFKVRLPSGAAPVDAFALVGHNFDGTETDVFLEGNDADTWDDPAFSLELDPRAGLHAEFLEEAQNLEWWRLRFTTAHAGDVRRAGRLMLGTFYECARNPKRDAVAWGYETTTATRRVRSGQSYSDRGALLRTFSAKFDAARYAQVQEWAKMAAAVGTHTPLLMSFDHDRQPVEWALYGKLTKLAGPENVQGFEENFQWNLDLEMVEEK